MEADLKRARDFLHDSLRNTLEFIGYDLMGTCGGDITISFGSRQPCKNYGMIRIDITIEPHDLVINEYLEGDEYTLTYKKDDSICYPGD
jgi:hypothetical protein